MTCPRCNANAVDTDADGTEVCLICGWEGYQHTQSLPPYDTRIQEYHIGRVIPKYIQEDRKDR